MTKPLVTILYEDQLVRGTQPRDYGLHQLVLQCVADRTERERHDLARAIKPSPRKGRDKVIESCRRHLGKLTRNGGSVIAVLDQDQAWRAAKLPKNACRKLLREKLSEGCEPAKALTIVFLQRNLESVLGALRACDPTLVGAHTWTRAIDEKRALDRDLALKAAARSDRSLRKRLQRHMPSFGYLVAITRGVWEALPR